MTDRLLLFICRQAKFFYRKWPSHGGGPVLTVPLLCVAEWTHTLASERAHTTPEGGGFTTSPTSFPGEVYGTGY